MEPHSWIIAIAGMAYLYYLSLVFDKRRIYLIKKSRIHQPTSEDDHEIRLWKEQFETFQRELKLFRVRSVLYFSLIPFLEMLAHAYFGNYLVHIWWIPTVMCLAFMLGLIVMITEMSGPQPLDIRKLDRRSLLYR